MYPKEGGKLGKLLKSKKGLSPVIATIILIAVTVAVSIAVAAWMGALTFGFMATEQVSFTGCTFHYNAQNNIDYANVTVKNTGTSTVTINAVQVNSQANGTINSVRLTPGASKGLLIMSSSFGTSAGMSAQTNGFYVSGNNYAFAVVTTKNNRFGPYTVTAPS